MIASKVVSDREVFSALKASGFERTSNRTATGTFWKHTKTGKHLLVPKSVQKFYPDWLLYELSSRMIAFELPLLLCFKVLVANVDELRGFKSVRKVLSSRDAKLQRGAQDQVFVYQRI